MTIWQKTVTANVTSVAPPRVGNLAVPELPSFAAIGLPVEIEVRIRDRHTPKEWANAYAVQATDDLRTYSILRTARTTDPTLGECHELHYLQMALEKTAKAFLLKASSNFENHRTSHEVFEKFQKNCFRDPSSGIGKKYASQLGAFKVLGKAIEKLAPAVARDVTPENVEYPWSNGSTLFTPAKESFQGGWGTAKPHLPAFVQMLGDVLKTI